MDKDINTPEYWDVHQTAFDFGLRQQKYTDLVGTGDSIIELGCGLSPFLSKVPFVFRVGIDYSKETVKRASWMYPEVKYFKSDALNVPFQDGSFDAVVSGEMIEHLEEPDLLILEMDRLCKTGGIMVLSTPILEFLDPEHLWEFSEKDFQDWGFTTEKIDSERFQGRSYIFAWKRK